MTTACAAHGCALIGGETADMPDIYAPGDFDLVGLHRRRRRARARDRRLEDRARATCCSRCRRRGLHTNGYSLVRKVFGIGVGGDPAADRAILDMSFPGLEGSLGDALLAVHRSYYADLKPVLTRLHGIAHITGGGLIDNVPRILPDGLAARVRARRLARAGAVLADPEAGQRRRRGHVPRLQHGPRHRLAVAPEDAESIGAQLRDAKPVGRIIRQVDERRVIIN